MNRKFRVAIFGIGGVGGYIGGKLAGYYKDSPGTEVIFISRGDNKQAIIDNGLKVISAAGEMIVHPHLISNDPEEIGYVDLLLCCTKAYSLEDGIKSLEGCISSNTLILPLLNGVDSAARIRNIFPVASVLQGCIYIVSKLIAPGVIKQSGDFYSMHFGSDEVPQEQLVFVEKLFKEAGINVVLEDNILRKLWQKFSFLSPVATYTSAFNISLGKILDEPEHRDTLRDLMIEVLQLAGASGIELPADIVERNFELIAKLPYEATSSMQADFSAGKNTELETLTGFVAKKAKDYNLDLKNYDSLYQQLSG